MLEVLVTGFPNCGTSFLCELVAAMGFDPGSKHWLKGADDHNRYGYWEHLQMRRWSWEAAGGKDAVMATLAGAMPEDPLPYHERAAIAIERWAGYDRVEVYKDAILPLVYHSFPAHPCIVTIGRNLKTVYGGYFADAMGADAFVTMWARYWSLVQDMAARRDVLQVRYEDFADDTEEAIRRVCRFVGRDYSDELRMIWRPRS